MSSIKEEYIKHKYIRDNEFVTDAVTIMGCREERSRDVIDNLRLGTYDNFGNYKILDSIKEELIRLPKVVTLTSASSSFAGGNDEYEAKANIPIFGDIKFKLVVNRDRATFFLIEKINREAGGYIEIYEEKLESIDLRKEALDLPFIFSYFNMTNEDIDLGQKWQEINIPNILTRKVYLAAISKKIKENNDQVAEEQAFNRMVDMLRDGGEYGKKILDRLDERMNQNSEFSAFKGTNAYGKALNDILFGTIHHVNSEEVELSLENKELYLTLLELRNSTTKDILTQAKEEVSNADVETAVTRINELMKSGELDEDLLLEYPDEEGARELRGAILKRKVDKQAEEEVSDLNEDGTPKTKEQKIKEILEGKSKAKQQKKKAQKKVTPAKKPQKKQKLKAKGKKTAKKKVAKGKKGGKGGKKKAKKKLKKPIVKKEAKGLKPAKAKKGAAVQKKKKKKKNNSTAMGFYRQDREFLNSLFDTQAILDLRITNSSNEKAEDVVILSNFNPLKVGERKQEPKEEFHKETNIFARGARKGGQLNSQEENNLFSGAARTENKYEGFNNSHQEKDDLRQGIESQQTIIPGVIPGGGASVMGSNQNVFGGDMNHTTNPFEQPIDLGATHPIPEESMFNNMPGGSDMNINDSLIDLSQILDSLK